MTREEIAALVAQVREVTAALQRGELARANELLRECRLNERGAQGTLPLDAQGDGLREAVAEALRLSLELQATKRTALTEGGTTRRAIGAYARRRNP